MMRIRCPIGWAAALLAIGGTHPVLAQWPPDTLENLQVLPEDISVRELVGIMRGIAGGLGVRCIHCHVGDDPNDLASTNFVSDEKLEKKKARAMLRMVQRINRELLADLPERSDPPVEVTCATCHHGVTKPVDIRDILVAKATAGGADSAIAEYRRLRERYYGSYSYDFRDFVLANVAERLGPTHAEAAIRILEFNLELHPESMQSLVGLAQFHAAAGEFDQAMAVMDRARAIAPGEQFIQRMVDQIEARRAAADRENRS